MQWDNSAEYSGLEGNDFLAEIAFCQAKITELDQLASKLQTVIEARDLGSNDQRIIDLLCQQDRICDEAEVRLSNLRTFADSEASLDGKNELANLKKIELRGYINQLSQAMTSHNLFLEEIDQAFLDKYFLTKEGKERSFLINNARVLKDFNLDQQTEKTILKLSSDGFQAWSQLYDSCSSHLVCEIVENNEKKTLGLAQAAGYLSSPQEEMRKQAFRSIRQTWTTQEHTCAAIINAMAGWRLKEAEIRSVKKTMHYMDKNFWRARISGETLDAMMTEVLGAQEEAQANLALRARLFGKKKFDLWDSLAPNPKALDPKPISFEKAIDIIKAAFSMLDPSMADFVDVMLKNNWIETRKLPNKRPGAYCTKFLKSRTPRVYMTYNESMKDMMTLAHELGHAYHNWIMRDLSIHDTIYPMTLAETASIMAETLVLSYLKENALSEEMIFDVSYFDTNSLNVFLLNIPMRYEFERLFYDKRARGNVGVNELKELAVKASKKYYGETISEHMDLYWASTLHYYIAGISFYNFPYTFGYLFALGIFAQKEVLKDHFKDFYIDLLRDTGRMTAEDLAHKHLAIDLRGPDFWQNSINMVKKKHFDFEKRARNYL